MVRIDATKSRVPIWLVWSINTNGNTVLNSICLEQQRADLYRKALKDSRDIVKSWVEKSEANHLYASMFEIPGRESIQRLVEQFANSQYER